MTQLDRLLSLPAEELEDILFASSPALWAQEKRGYTNAPVHLEWYGLMKTERRLCVVAPREHAKSETFTVNGSAHAAIYRPGVWTYAFAATGDQAGELKSRIDAAVSEHHPELVDNARVMAKMESIYANGSRITVAGVGKSVRGAHPDRICGDDVLTDADTATDYQRKKMERWWSGTVGPMAHPGTTRLIPGLGRVRFGPTQVFLVGTPFHSQDLLMGMRTNPLYHFRRYSAEFDVSQLVPGTLAVEVAHG